MNNFEYYNPVRIVFGKGSIPKVADLIMPGEKILLTYGGGSIKRNGVYDQVRAALKGRGVWEFGGIEPNPRYETCMRAVDVVRKEGIDFLLAVGGGSVLDGTKFIAAAVHYEGDDPWDILRKDAPIRKALPLGAVLTLPATGSEMNSFSGISRESTREKLAFGHPAVFPRFSILDPEVTYSLPKKQLRNGIVDTFVHVMEQYATYDVNSPLQDRQAEGIVRTLIELAERILADPPDYEVRANFMWCATQALNGIIGCGVVQDWSTHMIGHELTAFFGLAHAESLAVVLPGVWRHEKDRKQVKLAQLARRVWQVEGAEAASLAEAAIERTVAFFHAIEMPTRLGDYGVREKDIEKVVARLAERKAKLGEHQMITPAAVREILRGCL